MKRKRKLGLCVLVLFLFLLTACTSKEEEKVSGTWVNEVGGDIEYEFYKDGEVNLREGENVKEGIFNIEGETISIKFGDNTQNYAYSVKESNLILKSKNGEEIKLQKYDPTEEVALQKVRDLVGKWESLEDLGYFFLFTEEGAVKIHTLDGEVEGTFKIIRDEINYDDILVIKTPNNTTEYSYILVPVEEKDGIMLSPVDSEDSRIFVKAEESNIAKKANNVKQNEESDLMLLDIEERFSNSPFSNTEGSDPTHVYYHEKEMNHYIIHEATGSYYLSIANKKDWVKKDLPIYTNDQLKNILKESQLNPELYDFFKLRTIFYENHMYIFIPDKQGDSHEKSVILDFEIENSEVVFKEIAQKVTRDSIMIKTNQGKMAYMFDSQPYDDEFNYKIYYIDEESEPIFNVNATDEFNSVVNHSTNTIDNVYLDVDEARMYLGNNEIYQLDLRSGEPIWNDEGQEKVTDINPRESIIDFIGDDYLIVVDPEDDTMTKYDKNLQQVGNKLQLPIDLKEDPLSPAFLFNKTSSQMQIWTKIEFQGEEYLKVVNVEK